MSDLPNVLFVMTDQQKASTLGCYGSRDARTPAVDGLAARGVLVEHAVCNYPACTPARAAVHTGRYPHTTRVRANHLHLPPHEITLPHVLRAAGYEVALFGKNHVFADASPRSQARYGDLALRDWPVEPAALVRLTDELAAQGRLADERGLFDVWFQADHFGPRSPEFAALRAFASSPPIWRSAAGSAVTPFPVEQTTSAVLAERAEAFVRERAARAQPWFAWLSFPDPHNPYTAPEPFASWYDPERIELPPHDPLHGKPERQRIASRMCGMHDAREDDLRRAVALHLAQVSAVDAAVGRVLRALRDVDAERRTLVVFTTDHGGYVGDHGAWHKAPAFYDCLIRIPLVFSWPGVLPEGARMGEGFVEQVDLLPTLLELVGLPVPPGVQGVSAALALLGRAAGRDVAFAEVGEAGDPVTWDDLPFLPDGPLDDRFFPWDGFREAWIGQGKMVRTGPWKYAWYANGDEELYHLGDDPDELVNLAAEPVHAGTVRALRDRLLRWTVESEDQLPLHAGNVTFADALAGIVPSSPAVGARGGST